MLNLYSRSFHYQVIEGQDLVLKTVSGVDFCSSVYFVALYFGGLVLIKPLLIFDFFLNRVGQISIH